MKSSLSPARVLAGVLAVAGLLSPRRQVAAQSSALGALTGRVEDLTGRSVASAEVRVRDRVSGATRAVVASRDGRFSVRLLSPSSYDVTVEALGFRPVVHVGVHVGTGGTAVLRVRLRAEAAPVTAVDTVRVPSAPDEPLEWLTARGYPELVGGRRLASDAALLSPVTDERAVEGLPWRYADAVVDGSNVGQVASPGERALSALFLGAPLRGVAAAVAGGTGFDVERSGAGVGLSTVSRSGGGALATTSAVFGGTGDAGAAFLVGGPIERDTSSAIVGLDFQRTAVSRPAWVLADDATGLALLGAARDSFATDLSDYRRAVQSVEERLSGFGRLDLRVGDRSALMMRASGSRLVGRDAAAPDAAAAGIGSRRETAAGQAAIALISRLSERVTSELRLSADFADASAELPLVAGTSIAARGLVIGGGVDEPFRDARTTPRFAALLHWGVGAHQLKAGATFASHRIETQGTPGGAGRFAFGDEEGFAAATGAWRGFDVGVRSGSFRLGERALLVQDAWRATERLEFKLGLRVDGDVLPRGEIDRNEALLAATGLDNTAVSDGRTRVAPRLSFRWALGAERAWTLEGGAGVYHDLPDRDDVASALTLDAGIPVRAAVGTLGGWPLAPDSTVAPVVGRAVSLFGPDFEGPRTRRVSVALQRAAGAWIAYARATYRQTDFLARRRDLNLPATAVGTDQYGRPLVGTLRQAGALLAAVPGADRRFTGFETIEAIEATGFSEYWGATVGVERVVDRGLTTGVHYTFSRTTDNLAGGRLALAPLTTALTGAEWAEGTSDVDVPHRVIVATEWSPSATGAVRVGAVYRLRSGTPFTPGFAPGVDANGDGVAGNDPAFVDAGLTGMAPLLEAHECLRISAGAFAERNGCRGEWVQRLDLRVTLRLSTLAAGPLDLVVDAIDVIPAMEGRIDDALYLVDRTAALVTNPGTRVTTVPLVVNPRFGTVRNDRSAGTLLRVGLRFGR